jgi:hypothetical protein
MENIKNIKLKVKLIIIYSILLMLLIIFSCESMSPKDVVNEYDMYLVPKFIFKAIDIPPAMQESSDSIAQMLVSYFNIYNDTENYLELMDFENQSSINYSAAQPWVKRIPTNNGMDITVTLDFEDEIYYNDFPRRCVWEVFYNGRDSVTGNYYDNWKSLEANLSYSEQVDMALFAENSDNVLYWISKQESMLSGDYYNIECYQDNEIKYYIAITIGDRKSFRRTAYKKDSRNQFVNYVDYSAQWFSDGSGEWTQYSESGEAIATGTW